MVQLDLENIQALKVRTFQVKRDKIKLRNGDFFCLHCINFLMKILLKSNKTTEIIGPSFVMAINGSNPFCGL